ncbi:MAG: type II toxin-antitoxin system PemK/MazF family toxin [Planctomycetes bacterium]|nr:type II toxin-antitoxin system PemK/MazF family toxin [Planctomycetota bacterium]
MSSYRLTAHLKKTGVSSLRFRRQDILVARVTTQPYLTKTDYKILHWGKSGLLTESYIRLGKLATIKKQYVVKHLGKLETVETDNIKSILEKMFLL